MLFPELRYTWLYLFGALPGLNVEIWLILKELLLEVKYCITSYIRSQHGEMTLISNHWVRGVRCAYD